MDSKIEKMKYHEVGDGKSAPLYSVAQFEQAISEDETFRAVKFKRNPFVKNKGWGREFYAHSHGDGVSAFYQNDNVETVKVLYFEKNKKCSLHYHQDKFEVFYMLHGSLMLELVWNGQHYFVEMIVGDYLTVPRNLIHQMTGLEETNILLEISTQDRDRDSYRISKGD